MSKPAKRKQDVQSYKRAKVPKTTESTNTKNKLLELQVPTLPTQAGTVLVCGQSDIGQLGLGPNVTEKKKPFPINNLKDVVAIAAGGMHNLCLTKNGEVYSFGCNDEGALGRNTDCEGPDDILESLPGKVDLPSKTVMISAGDCHSCALLEDGTLYVWGAFRDSHGILGLIEENTICKLPVHMKHSRKIVKISSGSHHILLLDILGNIYSCGCAEQGQLGRINIRFCDRSDTRNRCNIFLTLRKIELRVKLKKLKVDNIWAGNYGSFVRAVGSSDIYVCGLNNYYQLALPNATIISPFPQRSLALSKDIINWKRFSLGQHHTLAIDNQGKCYVWGRYEYGRLGLGNITEDPKNIVEIPGLKGKNCIDVSCGSSTSFVVTADGDAYSWGMGGNGDLGTGNDEDVYTPTKITGKHIEGKRVIAADGGGQHLMLLVI